MVLQRGRACETVSRGSITMQLMPRCPSSIAVASPTGPPPAISTRVRSGRRLTEIPWETLVQAWILLSPLVKQWNRNMDRTPDLPYRMPYGQVNLSTHMTDCRSAP
jgi:hypothetical protein